MKTAMQELMEWLDDSIPVPIKEKYIEKEKEQIIDAFEIGYKDGHYTKSNDFYNNLYNQNES
jgi:predicted Zn-dependent peptidase